MSDLNTQTQIPVLQLRDYEWYKVVGEVARARFILEKEGIYTLPTAVFILPERLVKIKYDRVKREYRYSEPVDFDIVFDGVTWKGNCRVSIKPADTTIYDNRLS